MVAKRSVFPVVLSFVILCTLVFASACIQETEDSQQQMTKEVREQIKTRVTGIELEYSTITGEKKTYVVQPTDISAIESVEMENETVWKVTVGKSPRIWHVYLDESGEEILRIEQGFQA